jgi:GH15 family glucan-1,4-alpha-glucosidase
MLSAATKLVGKSAREVEACWNPKLRAYAQEPGSTAMDASLLQLITLHFLDPRSDRAATHLAAIESQLLTEGGLLYRYRAADDFGVPENAFLVCAFWHVETPAMTGRLDDALRLLESLLGFSNHLGLFSEHVDAATGSQWGNFPQTCSHVDLMNAVFRISSGVDYPEFF